ncbi:glycine cleavage system protein GcvH [Actinotalea sp. AC32]|nr:glycine cleavage system protein GcvH [Actinotalea sp. AC32]
MSENVPDHLQYTAEHEWVDGSSPATVGITRHAADALGELVYVELPEVGTEVTAGSVCGELESTKSVSEIFAPVTGRVVETNQAVVEDPSLVNSDPYGAGWLLKVEITTPGALISADEYSALVQA